MPNIFWWNLFLMVLNAVIVGFEAKEERFGWALFNGTATVVALFTCVTLLGRSL